MLSQAPDSEDDSESGSNTPKTVPDKISKSKTSMKNFDKIVNEDEGNSALQHSNILSQREKQMLRQNTHQPKSPHELIDRESSDLPQSEDKAEQPKTQKINQGPQLRTAKLAQIPSSRSIFSNTNKSKNTTDSDKDKKT